MRSAPTGVVLVVLAGALAIVGCGDAGSESKAPPDEPAPLVSTTANGSIADPPLVEPGATQEPVVEIKGAVDRSPIKPPPADRASWPRRGGLRIDLLDYDFGRVREDQPIRATFHLEADGDEPVQIIHVERTCGCAHPKLSGNPIRPGSPSVVTVDFDPLGRPGAFRKPVILEVGGRRPAKIELFITAMVEPTLSIVPRALSYGRLQPNTPSPWHTIEFAALDPEFRIDEAAVVSEDFELESLAPGAPVSPSFDSTFERKRLAYRVRFKGGPEFGRKIAQARFRCNDARLPEVVVQLIADVETPLRAQPHLVPLVLAAESRPLVQLLRIVSTKNEPVTLGEPILSLPDGLELSLSRQPADPTMPHVADFLLRGTVPARGDWKGGEMVEGRIVLPTGRQDQPVVVVTVRVICRR